MRKTQAFAVLVFGLSIFATYAQESQTKSSQSTETSTASVSREPSKAQIGTSLTGWKLHVAPNLSTKNASAVGSKVHSNESAVSGGQNMSFGDPVSNPFMVAVKASEASNSPLANFDRMCKDLKEAASLQGNSQEFRSRKAQEYQRKCAAQLVVK